MEIRRGSSCNCCSSLVVNFWAMDTILVKDYARWGISEVDAPKKDVTTVNWLEAKMLHQTESAPF
jgi:hypothetical protein